MCVSVREELTSNQLFKLKCLSTKNKCLKQGHLTRKIKNTHQGIFLAGGYELRGLKVKKSSEHFTFQSWNTQRSWYIPDVKEV